MEHELALSSVAGLGLEPVDEIDDVVEAPASTIALGRLAPVGSPPTEYPANRPQLYSVIPASSNADRCILGDAMIRCRNSEKSSAKFRRDASSKRLLS